jgi:hypothetical protein
MRCCNGKCVNLCVGKCVYLCVCVCVIMGGAVFRISPLVTSLCRTFRSSLHSLLESFWTAKCAVYPLDTPSFLHYPSAESSPRRCIPAAQDAAASTRSHQLATCTSKNARARRTPLTALPQPLCCSLHLHKKPCQQLPASCSVSAWRFPRVPGAQEVTARKRERGGSEGEG